jgi:ankyrin repeat protein
MNRPWYYEMDDAGETPMSRARKCGHRKLAELLLRHDQELMQTNDDDGQRSELQRVAFWGLADSVHDLLEEGVNPQAGDEKGDTPLHEAARNGHKEIVEELLQHGADVNEPNHHGMTTLHWVAMNGREDLAELLLDQGAEVNPRDEYAGGMTPRAVAMLMGYDQLAELIGSHGGGF